MCKERLAHSVFSAALILVLLGIAWGDIESGLMGYWPLDGDAVDGSGHGLDGTINGNVETAPDRMGYADSALLFPGAADSHVSIGEPPELSITGELTLAAWVFLNSDNANNGRIIAKAGGGGQRCYSLNIEANSGGVDNPATFQIARDGNSNISVLDTEPLPTDEWVHMAGVYRPGEVTEIYVNGELKNTNATDIPDQQHDNSLPVLIGARNACGNCGWDGLIDEARIYARALSPEDIAELVAYEPAPRVQAWDPTPADGANNVTVGFLEWKPGVTAAMHEVYFGTDPNLGPEDLVQPRSVAKFYFHPQLVPGTTYYWRVDEIEPDMTTVHEGEVWSFLAQPLTAYMPDPADGTTDAPSDPNMALTWLAGLNATSHQVFFSSSFEDVNATAAGADKGTTNQTSYSPGALDALASYYWRVDELDIFGTRHPGPVWAFSTYQALDDFESYDDDMEAGTTVYDAWIDGYTTQTNGSYVGYEESQNGTFGETREAYVYRGAQSMPMDYNNAEIYTYSEAEYELPSVGDWTADGIDTLIVHVRGRPSNDPATLYVGLTDTADRQEFVPYFDAGAVRSVDWVRFAVPLSQFADEGINLSRVRSLTVGVGDRSGTTTGGAGRIFVDEIWLTRPAPSNPRESAAQ